MITVYYDTDYPNELITKLEQGFKSKVTVIRVDSNIHSQFLKKYRGLKYPIVVLSNLEVVGATCEKMKKYIPETKTVEIQEEVKPEIITIQVNVDMIEHEVVASEKTEIPETEVISENIPVAETITTESTEDTEAIEQETTTEEPAVETKPKKRGRNKKAE